MNSGSSSGPIGGYPLAAGQPRTSACGPSEPGSIVRPAGCRLIASCGPTRGVPARCCGIIGVRQLGSGRPASSHAIAPTTGSTVIRSAHFIVVRLRISSCGVMMASIKQYAQKPAVNRTNSTPSGNMAAA